jgi:hypothetical protein
MFKPISTLSILALVALALFVAGCGGSDNGNATASGDGSTTGNAPSKAEFIKQAEDICGKADTREANGVQIYIVKNRQSLKGLSVFEVDKKIILQIVLPSIREEVKELKALGLPEEDKKELEKYFDEVARGLEKGEKAPLTVENEIAQNAFFGAFKTGKAYGFYECARIY